MATPEEANQRLYFARPLDLYDTSYDRWLIFCVLSSIESDEVWVEYLHDPEVGEETFEQVFDRLDGLVVAGHRDGRIGRGVATAIQDARARGLPVWAIDPTDGTLRRHGWRLERYEEPTTWRLARIRFEQAEEQAEAEEATQAA